MEIIALSQTLDAIGVQMPVQWVFKDRYAHGGHSEVLLRRVIAGNEAVLADPDAGGTASHLKGKFSDAQTLLARFEDGALEREQAAWMRPALGQLLGQMVQLNAQLPELVQLFAPKGKIEIYGPNTQAFSPQYISGNFTLKLHVSSFDDGVLYGNLFAHLIAQHLDYPFGPGERRFSTSRIFDLCFTAEKTISEHSLAAQIDRRLEARGVYQPQRHELSDYEHTQALLEGSSALIRTSYERVLQRERFAAMVAELYGKSSQLHKAPLLWHYRHLLQVTLLAHAKNEFKDYPPRAMDAMAQTIHIPIAMMFQNANLQALSA